MKLTDLPTPCLVLDREILKRNIRAMADALARHRLPLRPHMKTAKSIDVARLALAGQPGGITVSTLAEAEYFAAHGITDILYAVGIVPHKLPLIDKLAAAGAQVTVVTDDRDAAEAIAAWPRPPRTLIEIDSGEGRSGVHPESDLLLALADTIGPHLAGVMTHAGHSYAARGIAEIARVAEQERAAAVTAAQRLRAAGHPAPIVSVGSSPTAMHAEDLSGVTEVRAGVYMFGDLFQAEIETHARGSIAVTVLASVIGRRPARWWWMPVALRCRRTAAPKRRRAISASAWRSICGVSGAMATRSFAAPTRSMASSRSIRRIRWSCGSAIGCESRPTTPA